MGHSTGHPDRLKRPMSGIFGSAEYAKEELRAEIGALFTMRRTNTGFRFVHCMEKKYPRLQRRKSNVRVISDYMYWGQ